MIRMAASLALTLAALGVAGAAPAVEWTFDRASDVVSAHNIDPGRAEGGVVRGWTRWDPYIFLRLPQVPLDVSQLTWLTVRLYSSAPADILDIYYQTDDGRWCLGGSFGVQRGWATYHIDLNHCAWRETTTGEGSRQWGGVTKKLTQLRIDPGNQANRWVMLDYVKLSGPEPGVGHGVSPEPMGQARLVSLNLPRSVDAGGRLNITAQLDATVPPGLTHGTGYVRLCRGDLFLRWHEQPVALHTGRITLSTEFPLSAYWTPGPITVEFGVHELAYPEEAPGQATTEYINPAAGTTDLPLVRLPKIGGDPCLTINGKPTAPMFFCCHASLNTALHQEVAAQGIHLYSDWFGTSIAADQGHITPDTYDYTEYDRYFATILEADPEAYFLPHLGLAAPLWWQKAHPEELTRYADGTAGPNSLASELWRKEMGEDLRKLIAHLRAAPYANRILGILFYCGYTAEWQMWGTWKEQKDDYSAPALRAFRAFLRDRYGTDEALRSAWNDPTVTLETAPIPGMAARRPEGFRVLRDPTTERPAMDYYEFISHMDADALLHFAHIAREATGGRVLVGTYYAYLSAHGMNQQDSGHLAAREVFDSPDIDFLMSPPAYSYRNPGEVSVFMSATDSLRLRGKLWLDESDHRTYLSDAASGFGRAKDLHDTLGVFWREFSECLCKRAAVSFFDMAGGWFSDPKLLADMGLAQRTMQESLATRRPFTAEVGLFVDPDSFYWMRPSVAQSWLVQSPLAHQTQAGAPFDYCLLDDISQPWMPDYKLYVFLNAFRLTPEQRAVIETKLRRNHATALFVYAPGYFGDGEDPAASMSRLLGMRVLSDAAEGNTQALLDPASPLAAGIDVSKPVGREWKVAPVFSVDDPSVAVHARLASNGKPAVVSKPRAGWTCYYSATLDLPPAVMRNLARQAGVHLWTDGDDALYADGCFLGLHASTDGRKTLHLPPGTLVRRVVTGPSPATRGQDVQVELKRAETVLLELDAGPRP